MKNKIYIKDVFDFLQSLQGYSIDLAIIDPPYSLKKLNGIVLKMRMNF